MIFQLNRQTHTPYGRCCSRGFALPDLIFIACFLGLLATVSVPAFRKYFERAKVMSVLGRLKKISDGAAVYYEESDRLVRIPGKKQDRPKKRFPESTSITPARRCCVFGKEGKCEGTNWDTPTWRALGFVVEGRHRFRYQFLSKGVGNKARFTARAHADLDCDGLESTFERVGLATENGKVRLSTAVHTVRACE